MTRFQKPPLGTPLDWSNPLNKGLRMHLAMNEGHGDVVRDLSLYGNHGTLGGFAHPPTVASGWNPGQTGVGLNFDGIDDYVHCGNNPSLLHRNDFTITTILCPAFDIGNVGSLLEDRIGWYKNNINLWCVFRSGKQYYIIRDDAGDYWNIRGTKTSWNINEWYMLTLTYSAGNGYNVYVNGNSDGSGSDFGILMDGTVSSDIGYLNKYYTGSIDQTRILNRTWSAKECMDYAINPWQVYLDEDD